MRPKSSTKPKSCSASPRPTRKNNLLDLLKLQMELEQIDRSQLGTLGKNQLSYYNKILREQAEELDQQKITVQKQISGVCGLPYQHANSKVTVISQVQWQY